ncbi:MAG: GAF domain-containing protein [Gemmatimonadales bacterium]
MTVFQTPGVLPSEVVAALAQATAMQATPEVLYNVIRHQTEHLVDADAFYLALWDPATGMIHFVAHHDMGELDPANDRPLGDGPTSWVIRNVRSLQFDRPSTLDDIAPAATFGSSRHSASGAHVPLLFGDRLIGVLSAQSYRPGRFPKEAVQALEALAAHAAVALESGRLARAAQADREAAGVELAASNAVRAQLDRRLRELEVLRRTAHDLAGTADAEATMRYVAGEGVRLFEATHAGVVILDVARRTARHTVAINLPPEYTAAMDRNFFELRYAELLLRGEVVAVPDARLRVIPGLTEHILAAGFVSVIALPLIFGEEVIGVLAFGHDRPRSWESDELALARAFADQAALAIGKARLLDTVTRAKTEWQVVFDAAPSGLAIVDAEGSVVRGNRALARLTNVPLASLAGRALASLFPEWPWGAEDPLPQARSGITVSRLMSVQAGRMLVITLAPERDGRVVAVLDDVTREQEALEALRRSEARFRALLAAAPVAILTLERDGTFNPVNAAAFELLGIPAGGVVGPLADLLVPGERAHVEAHLAAAFAGETRECRVRLRRPDGSVRESALVAVPLEERGGVRTVLAIARDVTDEQALRERVAHAEKMVALGQLVSGVAHEINNPLAGITALAEALAVDERDEGTERILDTIRREAGRAARIVQELLLFSRQRPLLRSEVDLNDVVREVITVAVPGEGIWTLDLDPALPTVGADLDQVIQVVRNLVLNGAQAMAEQGGAAPGRIRTWAEADVVCCEVLDQGPGIAPDVLGRIFEPFFTTKAAGAGTGLGLSISHGIVRAHGGEIRAQNRPEGGARFWFELPRRSTARTR